MWSLGFPRVFGVMAVLPLWVGVCIKPWARPLMPGMQLARGQAPWITTFIGVKSQTPIPHKLGEADCLVLPA